MEDIIGLEPKKAHEEIMNGALLLDVRSEKEADFVVFDVENIMEIPLLDLVGKMDDLNKEQRIIAADFYGENGFKAANMLKYNGFENVAYIEGGMKSWGIDELPLKYRVENECSEGGCGGGCSCC